VSVETSDLVAVILGGGGAVFIAAVIKGWQDLRSGARSHDKDTLKSLAERAERAEECERIERADCRYWESIAGRYAWQLRKAQVEPVPAEPIPPSEREPAGANGETARS
jgi:hypothetical protein